jgi:hypothetical protein
LISRKPYEKLFYEYCLEAYHVGKGAALRDVDLLIVLIKLLSQVKVLNCALVIAPLEELHTFHEMIAGPLFLLTLPNPA